MTPAASTAGHQKDAQADDQDAAHAGEGHVFSDEKPGQDGGET